VLQREPERVNEPEGVPLPLRERERVRVPETETLRVFESTGELEEVGQKDPEKLGEVEVESEPEVEPL